MEFLAEYGMFILKTVTIVAAIVIVIAAIASAGQKNKKHSEGHIEVINLSEEINEIREGMQKEVLSEDEFKALQKDKKKQEKEEDKKKKKAAKLAKKQKKDAEGEEEEHKSRIYVLNFDGDVEASAVENLRHEISAIISAADEGDQVLLRLESPGGMVHSYGLAASQLSRLKQAKIELVVAVDQVAASGGYMMACVADKIVAAPFAVLGSIGVVAELPNFHRLLKHNKVDYEQHTAGEYKRTLTMFAENSDEARDKFKQDLLETHDLFKQFISDNRPALEVDKVATGEHWYGTKALELGLIDGIQTSDDYILQASDESDIYEVNYEEKKPLSERLSFSIHSAVEKSLMNLWQKSISSGLFKR